MQPGMKNAAARCHRCASTNRANKWKVSKHLVLHQHATKCPAPKSSGRSCKAVFLRTSTPNSTAVDQPRRTLSRGHNPHTKRFVSTGDVKLPCKVTRYGKLPPTNIAVRFSEQRRQKVDEDLANMTHSGQREYSRRARVDVLLHRSRPGFVCGNLASHTE